MRSTSRPTAKPRFYVPNIPRHRMLQGLHDHVIQEERRLANAIREQDGCSQSEALIRAARILAAKAWEEK
jgi:hypothetical protein